MGKLILHIDETIHRPLPAFESLEVGEVFCTHGNYYIKTEPLKTVNRGVCNAFNLSQQYAVRVDLNTLVSPVIAEITLRLE